MNDSVDILLFDLDGVIIEPRAYRLALNKTLEWLSQKAGFRNWKDLLPVEAEIAGMEACGIHDFWDMTNICFARLLTSAAIECHEREKLPGLIAAEPLTNLAAIRAIKLELRRPDYFALARKLQKGPVSDHPADLALQIFSTQIKGALPEGESKAWIKLLNCFLLGSRSVYESCGTRIFQNYLLGSSQFENTYQLPSQVQSTMVLEREDKALLDEKSIEQMHRLHHHPNCKIAIYTSRPGNAPKNIGGQIVGYSPEAETALAMIGLEELPMISMGKIEWLAILNDALPQKLGKPATTHALAAIICALSDGNDILALKEAYELNKDSLPYERSLLGQVKGKKVTVYVFEDSVSGIKPLIQLGNRLKEQGFNISVKPIGIASDPHKIEALQEFSKDLFGNINQALLFVLKQMGLEKD